MQYEYKCTCCGQKYLAGYHGDRFKHSCQVCYDPGPLHRVFSLSHPKPMEEHMNGTTMTPIRSQQQFDESLKKMSDHASEYTGIEHRYEPVDPYDHATLGVTSEGLDATNRVRRGRGQRVIDLKGF